MRYIVLFQGSCAACSKVAGLVRDISITNLEARALEDPQVTALLSTTHRPAPDQPSLLVIKDDDVQMLSGWAMRRRLAGVVGWRRSGTIVRMLAAEWRARLARSAGSHGLSRRGVIGATLAGLGGWAVTSGVAAASSQPAVGTPRAARIADPAEVQRAMASAPVRTAIRTWGPVQGEVLDLAGTEGMPVLAMSHSQHGILTIVDNSPGALQGGNPVALSIGQAPTTEQGLRIYSVTGAPIANLAASGGRVQATAASPAAAEIPGFNPTLFVFCFVGCVNEKNLSVTCLQNCTACGENLATGSTAGVLLTCPYCAVCAGPHALTCAKECA